MATPATSRHPDPSSHRLHSHLDASSPPTGSRASTPRPSISPLSSTSPSALKSTHSSPLATRDATLRDLQLQGSAQMSDTVEGAGADVGDQEDDRSSSLSDPGESPDDGIFDRGLTDDPENAKLLAAQHTLEVDSEAETERLEQTPQKRHQHADNTGKTPSKLSQAATLEDELSDPPSPLPNINGAGAASSTSTIATIGQKRKRSDIAESPLTSAESDFGESPRKRSHESPPNPEVKGYDDNDDDEDDEDGDNVEMPTSATGVSNAEDEGERTTRVRQARDKPTMVATKTLKSRKGKQKGKKTKAVADFADAELLEEGTELVEDHAEETVERLDVERLAKIESSATFDDLAKQFTAFKERLYSERLSSMDMELAMLSQPTCTHPEFLRQVAAVDARLEKQRREAHAFYRLRLQCVKDRTVGDRSQLHSQYFQHVRELRETTLYELGEDWYNIQKGRRQNHQEKDESYVFKYPVKKSTQIRQQAKYNQEVSVLSGVAKYVGFPAAPDIRGAASEQMEDDFRSMRISKRVHQPPAPVHPLLLKPVTIQSAISAQDERMAHEQFMEQNAWARPQGPVHTHGTPGLTHTPDWAEPAPQNSARSLSRNISGQLRTTGTPFTTPLMQRREQIDYSSSGTVAVNSDGVELPSSVVAAPPTSDRLHHANQTSSNQASPLHVLKQRQNGSELMGFRNASNVSESTVDTPQDIDREHKPHKSLPALLSEASTPHQGFGTSQIHRHGDERNEVYSKTGFRPREGVFGTPAPLPAPSGRS